MPGPTGGDEARAGLTFKGHGPAATGGDGWRMDANLFFECSRCGDLISGDPNIAESCSCGALHKDSDYCRVGSDFGDESIAVWERHWE